MVYLHLRVCVCETEFVCVCLCLQKTDTHTRAGKVLCFGETALRSAGVLGHLPVGFRGFCWEEAAEQVGEGSITGGTCHGKPPVYGSPSRWGVGPPAGTSHSADTGSGRA